MYSPLVDQAIAFALRAHAGQERKGQPGVPYAVHPLHVGFLLSRHGFEPHVVAAGVLHDVVEDSGASFADLARDFGEATAAIVAEVSEEKAKSWEQRKQHTIDAIATMSRGAHAVTAADKVHNLADLSQLLRAGGPEIWKLFRRGRDPTLDYYARVQAELAVHFRHALTDEIAARLVEVRSATGPDESASG